MAKIILDANGNWVPAPKPPFYKRPWFIILAVLFGLGVIGNLFSGGSDTSKSATEETTTAEVASNEETSETADSAETTTTVETTTTTTVTTTTETTTTTVAVSREYKNALAKAKDYLDYTSFSKEGLYDQLLYEKFPEDAARYAVDNISVDWNTQALLKAQDYLDYTAFSDAELYDQLLFEKFTETEAQYAIDNLPE